MESTQLVVGGIVWFLASICVATFAGNRGLPPGTYFTASLFLSPPVGFIAAAAARPILQSEVAKECPDCAEKVQTKARKCRFCGFVFSDKPAAA